MSECLVILGRQPLLGLAELESLYGPQVRLAGSSAALVQADVDFHRLGGAIKAATVIEKLDNTDWRDVERWLQQHIGELAGPSDGKLRLGVSSYGFAVKPPQAEALGLSLKKTLKKAGRSVRLVPNKTTDLSSAQVFHNRLAAANGLELLVVRDGERTIIARTTGVQDINAYTIRDRGRPKRDSRVGMLPPKLAQIIINLAVSTVGERQAAKHAKAAQAGEPATAVNWASVLDPFCGTGVILQEALLMNLDVFGTDIDRRMVDYARQNLDWMENRLIAQLKFPVEEIEIDQADATSHTWDPLPPFVACETYLGRPFTARPSPELLAQTVSECDLIIKKFLKNIHRQLPAQGRLCIAVPAWQVGPASFKHLPLVDSLERIGYNRVQFEQVPSDQLLYYREDQIVARQLLVLQKD